MRPFTSLSLLALILGFVPMLCWATSAPAVKVILTKIDATGSAGLCLTLADNKLVLKDVAGDTATSFPVDASTLKVTPIVVVDDKIVKKVRKDLAANQAWMLEDSTREGVKIVNNTLRTLIVISRIDRSSTLDYGKVQFNVPGHSLFILNVPPAGGSLNLGGNWVAFYGSYRQNLPVVTRPIYLEISPNSEGIDNGAPEIDEGAIFSSSFDLGDQTLQNLTGQ
jgi:hypothetical protein